MLISHFGHWIQQTKIIAAQRAFHNCTFQVINAHFVHHCTLKQALQCCLEYRNRRQRKRVCLSLFVCFWLSSICLCLSCSLSLSVCRQLVGLSMIRPPVSRITYPP